MMDRRHVSSGSRFEPIVGFSRALQAGDRIIVSGTGPAMPDGSCPEGAEAQTRRVLEIMLGAVAKLGGSPRDVVRTRIYLVDREDWETVGRVHGEVFGDILPAATMVVVGGLLDPRWLVEMELEAQLTP